MKQQVCNPFLPLSEYVPDGEPHVFGNRVYLYGSHDAAGSDRFCVRDYTVWSAPVDDLSDWTCHGVSYRREQDPHSVNGKPVDLYAPDCVRGNDGKYYLYYCAMGPNAHPFGPISVAVGGGPAGPFEYLGDVRWPDGRPLLKYLTNDPAVLNDDGRIWLYYGWGLGWDLRGKILGPYFRWVESKIFARSAEEIKATRPSIMNCVCGELEDDMLTLKKGPRPVLDSRDTAPRRSALYRHPFFEAASIRKFGGLYYLVYSSGRNNELAYATSPYPDRNFEYRGVIISNSDLGLDRNRTMKAPAGTIHGGIEQIAGRYYVFYHRCTHGTDFSRQACAEPIEILSDGTIPQVGVSSCGLNGAPLRGVGTYPAAICCHLYDGKKMRLGVKRRGKHPQIAEEDGRQIVRSLKNGAVVGYRWFEFSGFTRLTVTARGSGEGTLYISWGEDSDPVAQIPVHASKQWVDAWAELPTPVGSASLYLRYRGSGELQLSALTFGGKL